MNIAAMLIVAFLSSIGAANNVVLHDSSRNRDIPVKVYYPASQTGSLPLIVFSHGFGGTKDGYEYLGRGWAQAVGRLAHSDHDDEWHRGFSGSEANPQAGGWKPLRTCPPAINTK